VYQKEINDKKNISAFLYDVVGRIISVGSSLTQELSRAIQITVVGQFPTDEETQLNLSSLNPNTAAPLVFHNSSMNAT